MGHDKILIDRLFYRHQTKTFDNFMQCSDLCSMFELILIVFLTPESMPPTTCYGAIVQDGVTILHFVYDI